jgi:hypothetical protein
MGARPAAAPWCDNINNIWMICDLGCVVVVVVCVVAGVVCLLCTDS